MNARLKEIWKYPVKSAKGLPLETTPIVANGVVGDRQFVIMDENGAFLSQRSHPKLALLKVSAQPNQIVLSNGATQLELSLDKEFQSKDVTVWKDTVPAHVVEDLTDFIKPLLKASSQNDETKKFFLMRCDPHHPRKVKPKYTNGQEVPYGFADGFPLLITSTTSLACLNQLLFDKGQDAVNMERFRPNLVLEGWPAFYEDIVEEIQIGEASFRLAKPCGRCIMTNISQESGLTMGPEPFRTLKAYRKIKKESGYSFVFGWLAYLTNTDPCQIEVGEEVQVTSIAKKPRILIQ